MREVSSRPEATASRIGRIYGSNPVPFIDIGAMQIGGSHMGIRYKYENNWDHERYLL